LASAVGVAVDVDVVVDVVEVLRLVVVAAVFVVVAAVVVAEEIDDVCVGGDHGPQSPQKEVWSTSGLKSAALRPNRAAGDWSCAVASEDVLSDLRRSVPSILVSTACSLPFPTSPPDDAIHWANSRHAVQMTELPPGLKICMLDGRCDLGGIGPDTAAQMAWQSTIRYSEFHGYEGIITAHERMSRHLGSPHTPAVTVSAASVSEARQVGVEIDLLTYVPL
jgi:hypothetical protein